jgi:chromate reductase
MTQLDIVGICGSLRAGSLNRRLLTLAGEVMGDGMKLEIADYGDIPLFNSDVLDKGMPASVAALRERIRKADGVLVVSPEYNFSIPGVLKNAIDWVSRGDDQPFANKPVAIMSATGGPLGGARMQYDLRKVMLFMNTLTLVKPEVFVGMAHTKFGPDGKCTDELTRKFATEQMAAFAKWIAATRKMTA